MNWTHDTPLEIYADWLEDQGIDVAQLRMLSFMSMSDCLLTDAYQHCKETIGWRITGDYGSGLLFSYATYGCLARLFCARPGSGYVHTPNYRANDCWIGNGDY